MLSYKHCIYNIIRSKSSSVCHSFVAKTCHTAEQLGEGRTYAAHHAGLTFSPCTNAAGVDCTTAGRQDTQTGAPYHSHVVQHKPSEPWSLVFVAFGKRLWCAFDVQSACVSGGNVRPIAHTSVGGRYVMSCRRPLHAVGAKYGL